MFIDGFVFIGAKVMKIILKAYVIVEFMLVQCKNSYRHKPLNRRAMYSV
jgi:hypothetical protein